MGVSNAQNNGKFVLVLDAGHGGKDTGARGVVDDEKNITLAVVKKLGKLIEDKYKDVKVIYTRNDDTFKELWERADIANKSHANLFVSIHCNSASNRSANGTETYVMGLRRMDENSEVSKRENSVVLLEKDQKRYQKFDPNDPEAVIAFELMHSAYQELSLKFAQLVENNFVSNQRSSRGVKQAVFHVLRENASPAVLIELGFVSNSTEGTYLATEKGKDESAESIFKAFQSFKKEYDLRNGGQTEVSEKPKEKEKPIEGVTFKIQVLTSKNKYNQTSPQLNGLTNVEIMQDGDQYKYFYGKTSLVSERDDMLSYAKRKGFTDAFVVEFKNNTKLDGSYNYRVQFLTSNQKYSDKDSRLNGLKNVLRIKENKVFKYFYGADKTIEDADKTMKIVQDKGFKNAFIVKFKGEEIVE